MIECLDYALILDLDVLILLLVLSILLLSFPIFRASCLKILKVIKCGATLCSCAVTVACKCLEIRKVKVVMSIVATRTTSGNIRISLLYKLAGLLVI